MVQSPLQYGMTPLMHAAYKGKTDMCKMLLQHGADVNCNEHEHGYTALMFAGLSGMLSVPASQGFSLIRTHLTRKLLPVSSVIPLQVRLISPGWCWTPVQKQMWSTRWEGPLHRWLPLWVCLSVTCALSHESQVFQGLVRTKSHTHFWQWRTFSL